MTKTTSSQRLSLLIVTGVSGAGKSTALRALEDLDYYCADNLPLPLLPKFVELLGTRGDISRAALVVDARGGEFLNDAPEILREIRASGYSVEILFLDAPDDIVVRPIPRRAAAILCPTRTCAMGWLQSAGRFPIFAKRRTR